MMGFGARRGKEHAVGKSDNAAVSWKLPEMVEVAVRNCACVACSDATEECRCTKANGLVARSLSTIV